MSIFLWSVSYINCFGVLFISISFFPFFCLCIIHFVVLCVGLDEALVLHKTNTPIIWMMMMIGAKSGSVCLLLFIFDFAIMCVYIFVCLFIHFICLLDLFLFIVFVCWLV